MVVLVVVVIAVVVIVAVLVVVVVVVVGLIAEALKFITDYAFNMLSNRNL